MKILWLTWKDHLHPGAGGAEIVLWELSQRLVAEGHQVTLLTCGYPGATTREELDGVTIIRVGNNRFIHPWQALAYYLRNLRNKYDVVIEVVNTAPYFGVFFGRQSKRYLFYHQLAREIWYQETPVPISQFGYYFYEPLATRLLSRAGVQTITVSESTRADLERFGFKPERTHIISEGIEIEPLADLSSVKKYEHPTLLAFGAMRAMKRTLDQIKAYELAKKHLPDLRLKVAGDSTGVYGAKVLAAIKRSPYVKDIEVLGHASKADKIKLMQKSHLIMQTATKEGWGLTITEAASQGTPAVAYNVDGLRDSIRQDQTGIITASTPQALADGIVQLLSDRPIYERIRQEAWQWSQEITFDHSYQDFKKVLEVA